MYNLYRQAVLRQLPVIVLASLAIAAVTYLFSARLSNTHEVHFSYLTALRERETSDEYEFDGYYALQATDLFTSTVASWVRTPEVIVAAHERVGLTLPATNARQVTQQVSADKTAPQLVQVIVRGESAEKAELLRQGLQAVMADNIAAYHTEGIPALSYNLVATDAWASQQDVATPAIAVAAFGLAFIGLVNGVIVWESIKKL